MTAHDHQLFLTPAEIYENLTQGHGSQALLDEQARLAEEQLRERERADLVRSLANLVQAGWQGKAGAAAYGAAVPMAERMSACADKLNRAQDLLARQAEAFETAYHSVRPVSDPPRPSIDESFPFDVDHDEEIRTYQDAARHNIAVFRTYDAASLDHETNLPQDY